MEVIIMVTLEQVEKLRERTGITYEEAKKALEETNGDLLEAVINLEQQNRISAPESGGYYNSKAEKQETIDNSRENASEDQTSKGDGTTFVEMMGSLFRWCGKMIHIGNINSFEVMKDGKNIMMIPLTVLALLLIFAFWIVVPIIFVGLIFGYRYQVSGPDLEKSKVNQTMDTVSDATLRAVDKVVDAAENLSNDVKKNKGGASNGEDIDN